MRHFRRRCDSPSQRNSAATVAGESPPSADRCPPEAEDEKEGSRCTGSGSARFGLLVAGFRYRMSSATLFQVVDFEFWRLPSSMGHCSSIGHREPEEVVPGTPASNIPASEAEACVACRSQ